MAMKLPGVLIAAMALLVFFLVYRSLHVDFACSSAWSPDSSGAVPVSAEAVTVCKEGDTTPIKVPSTELITQYLKSKVEMGVFDDPGNKELADVDFSTRALLSQAVEAATNPNTEDGAVQEGLFNMNYGVVRVVRRLVVCSSYRTSLKDFTLISLSPEFTVFTSNPDFKGMGAKDPSIYPTCVWLEDGSAGAPLFTSVEAMNATGRLSVHNGVPSYRWMNEVHGTTYDTLMIHCSFPNPVGTGSAGGYLYLNISHGPVGSGAPSELVPVFHEPSDLLTPSIFDATSFQYEYAYCSAPSFTSLIPAHVKQFLMYHYALLDGKVHFFFYRSAEVEEETMAVLQPLIDGGILTLVDFSKESNYHIMYHGQAPAINDCLYRTRFLARWALFWDLDEYLLIPSTSSATLPGLLEEHKNAPWISFGKIDFRYTHCAPSKTDHDWAVERMTYRLERPFCMDTCSQERCGEMCKSEKGMRKWIANPRKVRSAVTHSINDPWDNGDGVALNTKVARFNHYRGLVAPRARSNCQQIADPSVTRSTTDSDGKTKLIKDDDLATVASTLKTKVEYLKVFGSSL